MIHSPNLLGPYDPAEFWGTVGDWYESTCDLDVYRPQEEAIAGVIEPLEWETVLDVGCGFGRLGSLIQRVRPDARYTGLDVCAGLLDSARQYLPAATFHQSAILDFKPRQTWDLVITAEVLMHQPADHIHRIIDRLVKWANRWIVSCDWHAQDDPGNSWNIPHDYPALYGDRLVSITAAGIPRQSIFLAAA